MHWSSHQRRIPRAGHREPAPNPILVMTIPKVGRDFPNVHVEKGNSLVAYLLLFFLESAGILEIVKGRNKGHTSFFLKTRGALG
jgi:hypothetical protein